MQKSDHPAIRMFRSGTLPDAGWPYLLGIIIYPFFALTNSMASLPVIWSTSIATMHAFVQPVISLCFASSGWSPEYFSTSARKASSRSSPSTILALPKAITLRKYDVYSLLTILSSSMTAKDTFGFLWIASILCPALAEWKYIFSL